MNITDIYLQEWLANSARQMSLAGCPAQWETPLGLPVIQPYHKSSISYVCVGGLCGS